MENEKTFEQQLENWLQEVLKKGNEYGQQIGLDFYPFQCPRKSLKHNADLLIIGANPGGEGKFFKRTYVNDLFNGGEQNAYISEANNPKWKINKPILEMFLSEHLRKILEDAVIMNVMYFNSQRVSSLGKYDNNSVAKATKFCTEKTKEFVEIIKPKAVLLLGMKAPEWLDIRFSPKNSILQSVDSKPTTNLMWKVENNGIPYYIIHHPSPSAQTVLFNFGENRVNLLAIKAKFEEIFSKI
jgi:uracil-DNA glycosylase